MASRLALGGWGLRTRGDGSALSAVRTDGWPALRIGRLQAVAALAGAGDVLTTSVVLTSEAYVEYNPLLDALAGDAVALAMAYFVALNCWYLGLAVVDLGWLSTASGSYQAAVMGSATVNNLVLFATGTSLLDVLGGSGAHEAKTWVGLVVAVAVAVREHDHPPAPELFGVAAVYGAGMVLL